VYLSQANRAIIQADAGNAFALAPATPSIDPAKPHDLTDFVPVANVSMLEMSPRISKPIRMMVSRSDEAVDRSECARGAFELSPATKSGAPEEIRTPDPFSSVAAKWRQLHRFAWQAGFGLRDQAKADAAREMQGGRAWP
jgi:hypothetical protein